MNPCHTVAVYRDEAVVGLVDAEELALLKDVRQLAVEVVLPAVVLAGELPAGSPRLHARVVVPDQPVATVTADVVEGADLVVHAPDDDQRGLRDRELLGEVAAVSPELLDPPDVQPGPLEDRLALELVELGRDRALVGHRAGPELRMVLRPGSLGRLRVHLRCLLRCLLHAVSLLPVASQDHAAVHADHLTGDEARFVGAEECARGRDVVGGPGSADGDHPGGELLEARQGRRRPRRGATSACRSSPAGCVFTVIPCGASSSASAFVRPITPPFDAT